VHNFSQNFGKFAAKSEMIKLQNCKLIFKTKYPYYAENNFIYYFIYLCTRICCAKGYDNIRSIHFL